MTAKLFAVRAVNRAPLILRRRLLRIVDFGDGTYAVGLRWSRRAWLAS